MIRGRELEYVSWSAVMRQRERGHTTVNCIPDVVCYPHASAIFSPSRTASGKSEDGRNEDGRETHFRGYVGWSEVDSVGI
jgi:hypothetical protein